MAIRNGVAFCDNCGEEIGPAAGYGSYGFESCGKGECEREARDQERAAYDEAGERAREDGYQRYR